MMNDIMDDQKVECVDVDGNDTVKLWKFYWQTVKLQMSFVQQSNESGEQAKAETLFLFYL